MNPEQTRTTNDLPTLTAARNEILNINPPAEANTMGRLVEARNAYLAAKGTHRSWWRSRFHRGNPPDLEAARQSYETERNQFVQLEARRFIESGGVPGAVITDATADPDFRQRFANEVTRLMINEMQNLTNREIAANQRSLVHRLWGAFNRHPVARAVVGLGLNATMAVAMAHGNVPLFSAAMAGRVALGTVGFEGAFAGIQRGLQRTRGDLRELNNAEVFGPGGGAPGGMNMAEVDRRLAAFQEDRILNRDNNLSPTEQLLWNRKHALLMEQIQSELTSANVVNWRRTRREAADRQVDITTHEGHRDAANTEIQRLEPIVANATELRDRFAEIVREKEAERVRAERAIRHADNTIAFANSILQISTDPHRPVNGFIKQGEVIANVEDAARRHVNADIEIARLRALNPPPPGINTLINGHEIVREIAHNELFNSTWNVEAVVDAYRDRLEATRDRRIQNTIRRSARQERDMFQVEQNAQQAIINTEGPILAQRRIDAQWNEQQRGVAEQARDNARNLTEDQAIIVYDILMGGEGRTGVAGRTDIPARANGLLSNDRLNTAEQERMIRERTRRRNRWITALLTSGTVNLAGPAFDTIDNLINPDSVDAAGLQVSGTNIPTTGPENIQGLNLPNEIRLPAGSNPWSEASKILQQHLGRTPTNSEIYSLTKLISENSNISVPSWNVVGGVDHKSLPVGYTLKLGNNAVQLINSMRGS